MRVRRGTVGAAALLLVLALSACGGGKAPTEAQSSSTTAQAPSSSAPSQAQSSNQPKVTSRLEGQVNGITFVQETHVNKDGSERIVVTTGEEEWGFTLVDGELPEERLLRMRLLTLSAHGYYSTHAPEGLDGKRGLVQRTSNHDFMDCYKGRLGIACSWQTAFGHEDDVYTIDIEDADQRIVPIRFDEEDQTVFADFWVAHAKLAPANGPDEEWIVTDYIDEYGLNPTRDELYAHGLDGLPFPKMP